MGMVSKISVILGHMGEKAALASYILEAGEQGQQTDKVVNI